MIEVFKLFPLFGTIVGVVFALYFCFNKNIHKGNSNARYYLATALFLTSCNLMTWLFDDCLNFSWLVYLVYQFVGFVYLLYAKSLLDLDINRKKWFCAIGIISLLHLIIIAEYKEILIDFATDDYNKVSFGDLLIVLDYFMVYGLNVFSVYWVYKKVKNRSLESINKDDRLHWVWIKKVFGSISLIYFGAVSLLAVTVVMEILFNQALLAIEMNRATQLVYNLVIKVLSYDRVEMVITSIFIFSIAAWSIKIPVFASYQLPNSQPKPVKKYAKSTLKDEQGEDIWEQVKTLMDEKHLYRTPTLRLTDVANEIGKPLPHVSQVINEKTSMSFLDFINEYRVNEAKELIGSEKSEVLTILAIAYEVGFNSKTSFYNSFKKVTGTTPSEYKKSLI
ncbi:AraC family transcriptional regulator [Prolixibacteraceae bacterium JC049]|nr:AraC family transcriptional regulator [Prolixibacteraceae bacterium JC049]